MKIGIYTPWDTTDPNAWSGMIRPMVESLRQVLDVELLPRVNVKDAPSERLRARVRGMLGRRSLPRHTTATARRRSAALKGSLERRSGPPLDAIVSIAGSTDILALNPELPLVQVTDATFPAIAGFYPLATGLGARNEREGMKVEQAGAAATAYYAVATEWAARSLVDDLGVDPNRVTVVPFGPGTPVTAPLLPRRPGASLRVLAVIGDWERKRGEDVVRAVSLARNAAKIDLTIVGRTPSGLPEWIRDEGGVDRPRLAELYAEHDVLVDLAKANAAGVVMTDALSSGLPVVATRVGGVETIIRDGRTGWLVDPARSVDEAARILSSLSRAEVTAASAIAINDAQTRLSWTAWAAGVRDAVAAAIFEGSVQVSSGRRREIVMVSPTLPSRSGHETAGERLVRDVLDVMEEDALVTVVTRDGPANRRALERGGVPRHQLIAPRHTRFDPLLRALGLVPAVWPAGQAAARELLTRSDVIDVQWEENGILIPALRRMNPQSRVVITLHDVLSQRFERQHDLQQGTARRVAWRARRTAALILERMILRRASDVIVLSEKDADLLPSVGRRARVHVIPPPIRGDLRPVRDPRDDASTPFVLFVGFMARWENEDAMQWFVTDILPRVRAHLPGVRVAVAGGGLRVHVVTELRSAGVEVLGFVDDLEALYRAADAIIAPLRYGAGVKFKVVDALVRGVPVVTTSVGNEGITPVDAAVVADSAPEFADRLVNLLTDRGRADAHARSMAKRVSENFGVATFRAALKEVYS